MDKYTLEARFAPALITMIPILIFYVYYFSPIILCAITPILPVVAGVSINGALLFGVMQLNRLLSKLIFQKWLYQDELNMPTTDYLLPDNPIIDKVSKKRYYDLIKIDFNIDMKENLQQLTAEVDQRKMIVRVVGQIRKKLEGNVMLLQHNIEYGFFRNLCGGAVLAMLFMFANIVISIVAKDYSKTTAFVVLLLIYLIPIVFSKTCLKYLGRNYADVLFNQYGAMMR